MIFAQQVELEGLHWERMLETMSLSGREDRKYLLRPHPRHPRQIHIRSALLRV